MIVVVRQWIVPSLLVWLCTSTAFVGAQEDEALAAAVAAGDSTASGGGHPICYVCGTEKKRVGNLFATVDIPPGFLPVDVAWCGAIEQAGLQGFLPDFACLAAQELPSFQDPCDCEKGDQRSIDSVLALLPTAQPTSWPTVSPTTAVPTVTASLRPSFSTAGIRGGNPLLTSSSAIPPEESETEGEWIQVEEGQARTEDDLASGQPSSSPSTVASSVPTSSPSSAVPTVSPSSASSSANPTGFASSVPTEGGETPAATTLAPTVVARMVDQATATPTDVTSQAPSIIPSASPTTAVPSSAPTGVASSTPSATQTTAPTTAGPSAAPSASPSTSPSEEETESPSRSPSSQPTVDTSAIPSANPSALPTVPASSVPPSGTASHSPSDILSTIPTTAASAVPSNLPSLAPSRTPTIVLLTETPVAAPDRQPGTPGFGPTPEELSPTFGSVFVETEPEEQPLPFVQTIDTIVGMIEGHNPESDGDAPGRVTATAAPSTNSPTSVAPTSLAPTTVAPTTVAPTTTAPTTIAPTTAAPTSTAPTTPAPTFNTIVGFIPGVFVPADPVVVAPGEPRVSLMTSTPTSTPSTTTATTFMHVDTYWLPPYFNLRPTTSAPATSPTVQSIMTQELSPSWNFGTTTSTPSPAAAVARFVPAPQVLATLAPITSPPVATTEEEDVDGFVTEDVVSVGGPSLNSQSITTQTESRISNGIAAVLSSFGMENYADDPDVMDTLAAMVVGRNEENETSTNTILDNLSDMLALVGGGSIGGSGDDGSGNEASPVMGGLSTVLAFMGGDNGVSRDNDSETTGSNEVESVVRCNDAIQAMVRQTCDGLDDTNAECAKMRSICSGDGRTSVDDTDDEDEQTCTFLGLSVRMCEGDPAGWNPNSVHGLYCGLVSQACQLLGSP